MVGPTDSGKSSLCKVLLNYGVRNGWAPTFVDLDIGAAVDCPGQAGCWRDSDGGRGSPPAVLWKYVCWLGKHQNANAFALNFATPTTAAAGQGSITVPGCLAATPVEAPVDVEAGLPVDVPLVYFFGHPSPSENAALYKHYVERLAHVLEVRAAKDPQVVGVMEWAMVLNYLRGSRGL